MMQREPDYSSLVDNECHGSDGSFATSLAMHTSALHERLDSLLARKAVHTYYILHIVLGYNCGCIDLTPHGLWGTIVPGS